MKRFLQCNGNLPGLAVLWMGGNKTLLRFILHYREVSTIIPGTKSTEQLKLNLSAADKRISEDIMIRLEKMWHDELQTFPLGW
jgi:aryl-alcohol dehydrogenase-like predicted oxidoreductase